MKEEGRKELDPHLSDRKSVGNDRTYTAVINGMDGRAKSQNEFRFWRSKQVQLKRSQETKLNFFRPKK